MKSKHNHPSHLLFLVIFVFLFSISSPDTAKAEEIHLDKITAADIIRRMAQTYGSSESYIDEGLVKSVFISKDGTRTIEKPFRTAFVRPDRFRFEFREKEKRGILSRFIDFKGGGNPHYIAFKDGKNAKVYWNIGPKIASKINTLSEALAAATGISSGAARSVPTMLIPSESQFRNAIIYYNPQRIEDAVIDGVDCFQISDPTDYRRLTLWIGKKDFLLRKIFREQAFSDFESEETTTYEPTINSVVQDKMLEFNAPSGK